MVSSLVQPSSGTVDLETVPVDAVSPVMNDATGPKKSPLVFIYGNERVIGLRPSSYEDAVAVCHKLFPGVFCDDSISFHTKDLDVCDGELAKISAEYWEEAVTSLKSITIIKDEKPSTELVPPSPNSDGEKNKGHNGPVPTESSDNIHQISKIISLKIRIMGEGRDISFDASRSDTATQIEARLAVQLGKNPICHHLVKNGALVASFDNRLVGALLEYRKRAFETAPTIYLRAPKAVEVSVTLSLSSNWTLSGTRPVLPIKYRTASSPESTTWKVVVHPSGALTGQSDGSIISELSWEAQKYRSPSLEIPDQGGIDTDSFNPNSIVLNDENAVLLSTGDYSFHTFFDRVLVLFGFDMTAQYHFTNAWKKSLKNHKYVAVHFLPQNFYSKAALLDVFPSPDVINRIFVLFQGVKESDLKDWPTALERGRSEDVSWCRDMIGGEFERASDDTLFRVLELGGMEITPSS
ncbi:hypothetical protein GALMADRAFT_228363 [Galerina marginata CBS 339.88]|uniref:Ubiquitin-like domain-containing protein n=1 Tax=Galerina marginata (strain CBS 339.88) TaxID=685588 RepID=A0A067SQM4_GALM3|nr:hypothetical protein GALMADRAFT_228363 [Galerina marginata CBS 339.88]